MWQAAKAEAAQLLALLAVFRLNMTPEAVEPVEDAILGLAADRVSSSLSCSGPCPPMWSVTLPTVNRYRHCAPKESNR